MIDMRDYLYSLPKRALKARTKRRRKSDDAIITMFDAKDQELVEAMSEERDSDNVFTALPHTPTQPDWLVPEDADEWKGDEL